MKQFQTSEFKKYDLFDVAVILGIKERIYEKIDANEMGKLMNRYEIEMRRVIPCLKIDDKNFEFSSSIERDKFINKFFASSIKNATSFKQTGRLSLEFGSNRVAFSSEEEKNEFLEDFVQGEEYFAEAVQKKLTR